MVDVVDLVVGTEDGDEAVSSSLNGREDGAGAFGGGDEGHEQEGRDKTEMRGERRPNGGPRIVAGRRGHGEGSGKEKTRGTCRKRQSKKKDESKRNMKKHRGST